MSLKVKDSGFRVSELEDIQAKFNYAQGGSKKGLIVLDGSAGIEQVQIMQGIN